jgi:hypothetical protein
VPGLVDKLEFAEDCGFHILAESQNNFTAAYLLPMLDELISNNQAQGTVVILDTLKKFTDVMDKRKSSAFSDDIRRFAMNGGTVVCLAHTNKNLDSDGWPIYGGTSDIHADCDCAYIVKATDVDNETNTKIAQFRNIKKRGDVAGFANYRYSVAEGLSYRELFDSVESLDDTEMDSLDAATEIRNDSACIDAVTRCINDGVTTKMNLVTAVAEQTGMSKRAVKTAIERYTGTDPLTHHWTFVRGERGAQVFSVLDSTSADVPSEDQD